MEEWILSKLGLPGILVAVVLYIGRWYFSSERAAVVELGERFIDTFANIPRRWTSEVARVRASIAEVTEDGGRKLTEDEAFIREQKIELKATGRALGGFVEDTWNLAVDAFFVLTPYVLAALKGWKQYRARKAVAPAA